MTCLIIFRLGFIAENADDEKDGVAHIEGYFHYLYGASGYSTPRSLSTKTLRIDVVEKNRNWLKLSEDCKYISPAIITYHALYGVSRLEEKQIQRVKKSG
jgi:hypothetical protein